MEVIVILIGASLIVAIGFLIAFIWNVKSGQYQDTYTPSIRILLDEEKDNSKQINNSKK
ncbi:cbb3-type cytochrome oxidase assembly protein CcoS [Ignavibacterium sp.]|uniref:cbb3-type cytochrome oxidase assembly protein CcoS n=1 Tax=Ignavibacterium TaxID=795750 RepID=UPI00345A0AD7|nr:cbb3-type cytochrome oxidase assembly protein CcoS [Ignavibacterium album]